MAAWAEGVKITRDGEDWCHELPSFAQCARPEKDFREMYFSAVFNETFDTAWEMSVLGNKCAGVVQFAIAYVEALSPDEADIQETAWMRNTAGICLSVFRGIISLCVPVPHAFGTSLTDVELLYPLPMQGRRGQKKPAFKLAKDLGKHGQCMALALHDSIPWQSRLKVYQRFAGAEAMGGTECFVSYLRLRNLTFGPEEWDRTKRLLAEFVAAVPAWQASFRPGCTAPHESLLVKHIKHHLENQECNAQVLQELEMALRSFTIADGKSLHANVLAQMQKASRHEAVERFGVLTKTFHAVGTVAEVPALYDSIKSVLAFERPLRPETVATLEQCSLGCIKACHLLQEELETLKTPAIMLKELISILPASVTPISAFLDVCDRFRHVSDAVA